MSRGLQTNDVEKIMSAREEEIIEAWESGFQEGRKCNTAEHAKTILQLLAEKKVLRDEIEYLKEAIEIVKPIL